MSQFKEGGDNNCYSRVLEFDFIRCVACLAVVVLHVTSPFALNEPKFSYSWTTSLALTSSTRLAVPLFVMISGYFLLRKPYPDDEFLTFYRKRLSIVALPLLFWVLFYFAFDVAIQALGSSGLNVDFFTSYFVAALKDGKAGSGHHLWYLYMLLGLYLATPFVAVWFQAFSRKRLIFATVFLTLAVELCAIASEALDLTGSSIFTRFLFYLPYFLLGKILGDALLETPRPRLAWRGFAGYLLATLNIALVYSLTDDTFVFSNHSPLVYAQAICFYVAVLSWKSNPALKFPNAVQYLASLSFGAYLAHMFFLTILRVLSERLNVSAAYPVASICILTVLVYFFSNLTTAVIKKIPYLRRVV